MQSQTAVDANWRTYSGKHVVVHARANSYAEQVAPRELRRAENAVDALEKLVTPLRHAHDSPIPIYLIDSLDEAAWANEPVGDDKIVHMVQPNVSPDSLTEPLTRILVKRWFGADAASLTAILNGLAGWIDARNGVGPSIEQANSWVRAELAAGRAISIVPRTAANHAQDPGDARALTSFVGFLVETYGANALRQFLSAYNPTRQDQAALAAYQRPLGALEESWLGQVRRPSRTRAFRTLFAYLIPLLKPYWLRELEILLYMLFGLTYSLLLPLSSKYLVDTLIPSGSVQNLVLFILFLFLIYVLNAVVGLRRAYVNNGINQRILNTLQEQLFAKLQYLSHNFYARAKTGDLISRLTSDISLVQNAMSQVAGVGIYLALNSIAAAVTILVLSPLLGTLVLIVVPLFAVSYFALRARFEAVSRERQRLTGEATAAAQENLSAYPVIKAFGMESRAVAVYASRLATLYTAHMRLVLVGGLFETSTGLAVTMGQLLVLGVGGYLTIQGQFTVGTLLAFIGLLPTLFLPIASLSNVGQSVQMASGALDRVKELLEQPIAIVEKPRAVVLPPLAQEIRFENVNFSYEDSRAVLANFDLTIRAGTHVAFVGPSGSGKSTVVNLLMRFWDPDTGAIFFDGHDLRDVTIGSLRGQIGIVFQDTFVFDTTVRENIALARPGATDAEIQAAARGAQLNTYIESLPAGYDTVLGERGVRMSGGQRQRLAIARVLLRDPRILILDEATSALDARTEAEIAETLAAIAQSRTIISITHRLTSALKADHIYVLDQGRVVERGNHANLMRAGGLYQQLYDEQTSAVTAAAPRV